MRVLLKLVVIIPALLFTGVINAKDISLRCWDDVISRANQEHTTYVIARKLDLKGNTFHVPFGSTLKFKWWGVLSMVRLSLTRLHLLSRSLNTWRAILGR